MTGNRKEKRGEKNHGELEGERKKKDGGEQKREIWQEGKGEKNGERRGLKSQRGKRTVSQDNLKARARSRREMRIRVNCSRQGKVVRTGKR